MIENKLKELLEKNMQFDYLEVVNESHLHEGHAGSPNSGQSHFNLKIVSDDFIGLSKVGRHSRVYEIITPLFSQGLHAISMRLSTKGECDGIT